jgi:hypothetical protein
LFVCVVILGKVGFDLLKKGIYFTGKHNVGMVRTLYIGQTGSARIHIFEDVLNHHFVVVVVLLAILYKELECIVDNSAEKFVRLFSASEIEKRSVQGCVNRVGHDNQIFAKDLFTTPNLAYELEFCQHIVVVARVHLFVVRSF